MSGGVGGSLVEHVELFALKANCPNKALKILDVQLYLVQVCQCNQVSFNTVNEVRNLVDSASLCIPHSMVSVVATYQVFLVNFKCFMKFIL